MTATTSWNTCTAPIAGSPPTVTAAIDEIERIVREESIDCDFARLDGYLFVPPGGDVSELDKELDAVHRAGLAGITRVARAPLTTFDTGPALRFPRQAQFHVLNTCWASSAPPRA